MIKERRASTRREGKGKYIPRKKVCALCVEKVDFIDYKDTSKLRFYISDTGKIEPRHRSGACARHQRALAKAIKRARFLALLPYITTYIRKVKS